MKQSDHILLTSLSMCARCGEEHGDLDFSKLVQPMEVSGIEFTHWATCPNTGAPILLRVDTYTA